MLFATNRTPTKKSSTISPISKVDRKIQFDNQNTKPANEMYFCKRKGPGDYTEIGGRNFFKALKELEDNTQILLYIHGFNNNPEPDVFGRAEDLQKLINKERGENFALVVPLMWPCDDDRASRFLDDYWDDQKAADFSGAAFSRMLAKFDAWRIEEAKSENPCTRRINILAHSMGNRVLRNAISYWGRNDHYGMVPLLFRNVFMLAADVVNHCFEPGRSAALLPSTTRNLVVYYAGDDLAMPASKVANVKNRTLSRRLGMTGVEDINKVPKNIYEVDCADFNNRFDSPKGHSYFLNKGDFTSPALLHMLSAMDGGRVTPNEKHHVITFIES
ncbi:alpha/beta hydrolase [Alteromonas confluentis]|uniref:Alpha/beta hydrolase n=1 Tax=Alteromonas confluentis TaxID=1656094 RepID=A0A1E7ZFB3_9ALTE|nr:alpha/beta hydrolase [Alteromonas confluentis]OFC72201.1 hypothetical protein BFC18_04395 [Alteromonas confluentis]